MSDNQNLPVIEMRGVNVVAMRDPGFTVVEDVNWSAAPGEFWVIAGHPQSGKSDFLMLTAGLMLPAAGSYQLFGVETEDSAKRNWPSGCAWALSLKAGNCSTS